VLGGCEVHGLPRLHALKAVGMGLLEIRNGWAAWSSSLSWLGMHGFTSYGLQVTGLLDVHAWFSAWLGSGLGWFVMHARSGSSSSQSPVIKHRAGGSVSRMSWAAAEG
jgi:hypothetical protein